MNALKADQQTTKQQKSAASLANNGLLSRFPQTAAAVIMFSVYTTVAAIDLPPLIRTLNLGIFGTFTDGEQWAPSPHLFPSSDSGSGPTISEIIRHHRASSGDMDKTHFVVADRANWREEGVLAINLNFDGFVDAARMEARVVGSAVPSVSVGNTAWSEALADFTEGFYPRRRFAVYILREAGIIADTGALLDALNFGLGSRKEYAPGVCRLASGERGGDVASIAREHARAAAGNDFDSRMFVVVDDMEWEDNGVEIVRLEEDGTTDSCVRPVDVAAEVLTWVHQGLSTWEEAKGWDEEVEERDH